MRRMKELSKGTSAARSGNSGSSPATKVYAFNSQSSQRYSDTPAPGDYETDNHSLAVRALKTHNKAIAQGKGNFMTKMNDDRSAQSMTEDSDPTLYSDYYLDKASLGACSRSANKSVREGRIGFNSQVPRCVDAGFEDRSPLRGPGTYDFHHLYGCGIMHGARQDSTTAFSNKAPLLGYIRQVDTPGVGDYGLEELHARTGSFSNQGWSSFAGNSARCADHIQTAGTAGPESYDQDHKSIVRMLEAKQNLRLPPFAVSSRRL